MFRVTVKNFQSIASAVLEVAGFTAVTGTNNTGKTSLMRAVRGLLQNARGQAFIRHGKPKTSVELYFDKDGRTVGWEKGRAKRDKPTYTIDGGKPIHPGQAVPDEVRELGIRPISAGNREVWPQVAPQFTGQIFLLDQPGSVLAEALADVDRVAQLNEALRLAESDKRRASADLRVKRNDQAGLEAELEAFEGLDDAIRLVEGVEKARQQAARVGAATEGLIDLRDRLGAAAQTVECLSGVREVELPSTDDAAALLAERDSLAALRQRFEAVTTKVTTLTGVEAVPTDFDFDGATKVYTALQVVTGLRDRRTAAMQRVRDLEQQLADSKKAISSATAEFHEMLGGLGECPLCGSLLSHDHGEKPCA